jgi:GNAT superfamily N-acetyltransferase
VHLTELYGVSMIFVDPDEALATDWATYRGSADVVRVEPAPADRWPDLRAAGFLPKPKLVTWLADSAESDEQFLAALTWKERQNIRAARHTLGVDALTIDVQALDEPLLDAFLPLYRQRVAEMRHGWAVAEEQRDAILADADAYFAVCVRHGAALVGCCLVRQDADLVRVRFSAVDSLRRRSSLARVLYLEAVRAARQRGYRRVSLGTDPNLYGHIAKAGLFSFKSRLGFLAYPAHLVDPAAGNDQADLVLNLTQLADPAMLLGYADSTATERLDLAVFTHTADLDVRPYQARFLHGCQLYVR